MRRETDIATAKSWLLAHADNAFATRRQTRKCDVYLFFVVSVADESDEESEKAVQDVLNKQMNEWMDASDFKATPTNKLDVSKTE